VFNSHILYAAAHATADLRCATTAVIRRRRYATYIWRTRRYAYKSATKRYASLLARQRRWRRPCLLPRGAARYAKAMPHGAAQAMMRVEKCALICAASGARCALRIRLRGVAGVCLPERCGARACRGSASDGKRAVPWRCLRRCRRRRLRATQRRRVYGSA